MIKVIGFELIKLLSKSNKVYCVSRSVDSILILREKLSNPENLFYLKADICKLDQQAVNEWIQEDEVDVLINNAGMLINKPFRNCLTFKLDNLETHLDDFKLGSIDFGDQLNGPAVQASMKR